VYLYTQFLKSQLFSKYMVTNDLIVAIELGSSKIAGAVGRKRADGSLQVLAYASEPAAGFVRRGVVYNID
jgi:cell division protein FtsA